MTTAPAPAPVATCAVDPLDLFERALEVTGRVVAAVAPDQWALPTPCEQWEVRELTNHFVGGLHMFATALAGGDGSPNHDTDWLGADPAAAYGAAAPVALAAWREPVALDQVLRISLGPIPGRMAIVIHLTEIVVHGADLAVATGHEELLDQQLCQALLDLMHGMGGIDPFRVPDVFGPETTAPASASAHQRLLAYVGRRLP
jgi:uncharacterized protein (TIGR03086 family)